MCPVKVRIRGIYATALTALFAERFTIVEPSEVIQTRLGIAAVEGPPEVTIQDKPDRHGVVVEGLQSAVDEVVSFLKDRIPWAVFTPRPVPPKARRDHPLALAATLLTRAEADFPKPAKDVLDQVRANVLFTIPGHHLLKTLAPERVDEVEAKGCPELAQALEKELVWAHYAPGKLVNIVHLKAGEAPIRQAGELCGVQGGRVAVRRGFRAGGLYDGLSLPKCTGDYGYVEFFPERWWSRRTYFRSDGELLGEIYNVQTPPEYLPGEIRYLDLEIDLVRLGEEIRVVDEEILKKKVVEGLISPALAEKAWEETNRLLAELEASRTPNHSWP